MNIVYVIYGQILNVLERIRAIRGQPYRGLRCLIEPMAEINSAEGPRAGFATVSGRTQHAVFTLDQRLVESQEGRGLDHYRRPKQPARSYKYRQPPQKNPVSGR